MPLLSRSLSLIVEEEFIAISYYCSVGVAVAVVVAVQSHENVRVIVQNRVLKMEAPLIVLAVLIQIGVSGDDGAGVGMAVQNAVGQAEG